MLYEVIDLLEDVALTIYNSKYSNNIILIGGYALMSRLNDEFRRTKDLDFNVDSIEVWDDFCNNIEELLTKETKLGVRYKLLKRKGKKGDSSDRLWLEGDGIKFTLDMNIRDTFAVVNVESLLRKEELETYSQEELLRDKLKVVFSNKVYRRLKDVIDLVYISQKLDFNAEELKTKLSNVGMDFKELELEYLLCIEEIKIAFTKFSGVRLNWTWEDFYRHYFNFLAPLYFYLKGDIIYPMIWDKERGVWFRDDSSGHN